MNDQHIKGKWDGIKGRVKEEVGHATGNDSQTAEGFVDRMKGKIKETVGDIKDKLKDSGDKALDTDKSRKIASWAITALFAGALGAPAIADDTNHEVEASKDSSRNPITGTVTETKKYKNKKKNADGTTTGVEHTDKTKYKKDGSVERSRDTDSEVDN